MCLRYQSGLGDQSIRNFSVFRNKKCNNKGNECKRKHYRVPDNLITWIWQINTECYNDDFLKNIFILVKQAICENLRTLSFSRYIIGFLGNVYNNIACSNKSYAKARSLKVTIIIII